VHHISFARQIPQFNTAEKNNPILFTCQFLRYDGTKSDIVLRRQ